AYRTLGSENKCLVYPPLAISLYELRYRTLEKVLPEDLLKPVLIYILLAIDFLHTEAKIIYTNIQENNIMLSVEDKLILVNFEEAEKTSPNPCKIIRDRVIYSSRDLGIPNVYGRPILSDFGEARFCLSLGMQWKDIQPLVYRAPETWDLFERKHLFYACDSNVVSCGEGGNDVSSVSTCSTKTDTVEASSSTSSSSISSTGAISTASTHVPATTTAATVSSTATSSAGKLRAPVVFQLWA
ncbi:protein kinase, partial [Penicillium cataractarum]